MTHQSNHKTVAALNFGNLRPKSLLPLARGLSRRIGSARVAEYPEIHATLGLRPPAPLDPDQIFDRPVCALLCDLSALKRTVRGRQLQCRSAADALVATGDPQLSRWSRRTGPAADRKKQMETWALLRVLEYLGNLCFHRASIFETGGACTTGTRV